MKKFHLVFLFLILTGISFSCRKAPQKEFIRNKKYREAIIDSHQRVGMYMLQNFIPGMAVAVSVNNQLVWAEGFGFANEELKVPATADTKFRIADVSKVLTALTAAVLHEQGQIDLYKPIREYLPDYPEKQWDFNMYQLGTYTSGMRDISYDERLATGQTTVTAGMANYKNDSLYFMPGEFAYRSNPGYDLIGAILEAKFEKPFATVVKETILDTLQLNSTTADHPYWIIPNRTAFYDRDIVARTMNAPTRNLRHVAPSVGFLSSVKDMVALGNYLLEPGFFSQETLDLLFTTATLNDGMETDFGFGWIRNDHLLGVPTYGQFGNVTGGTAMLLIAPEYKLVVAVAANLAEEVDEIPGVSIANFFADQIDPSRKEPIKKAD